MADSITENEKEAPKHCNILMDGEINSVEILSASTSQKQENTHSSNRKKESSEEKVSFEQRPCLLTFFAIFGILHAAYCTALLCNEIPRLQNPKKVRLVDVVSPFYPVPAFTDEDLHGFFPRAYKPKPPPKWEPFVIGIMYVMMAIRILVQVLSGLRFLYGIFWSVEKMHRHVMRFVYAGVFIVIALTISFCVNVFWFDIFRTRMKDSSTWWLLNHNMVNFYGLIFYLSELVYLGIFISPRRPTLRVEKRIICRITNEEY